jgi:Tol biopolymer transport system component
MGEVYKARDTRLNRTVAIKILPASLAADPQFRERFEREAKAVAALAHPNICTLYDVGRRDGTEYLVLEYLEGETLESRLKKGALPLDQALAIAIQIAGALDKAHRAGIVHRDRKPANVMLTKGGAKLLDFGLAKAGEPITSATSPSMLPTTPPNLTAQGTILGTFQYMAPEQIEGEEADARTDVFAFGVLVYEMLTGRKAFAGKTQASLFGAILNQEPPPISAAQPLTPPALDRIVKTCFAKDPDDRWQTMRDLLRELSWIAEPSIGPVSTAREGPTGSKPRLGWQGTTALLVGVVAVVTILGAYGAALILYRASRGSSGVDVGDSMRLAIVPPDGVFPVDAVGLMDTVLSPTGRHLAFRAVRSGSVPQIWLRALNSNEVVPVTGSQTPGAPFWSPDGREVAFVSAGKLRRFDVSNNAHVVIGDASGYLEGAWGSGGVILLGARPGSGLLQIAMGGGASKAATQLDNAGQQTHQSPRFLPDGKHFLFKAMPQNAVYVASLDQPSPISLLTADSEVWYSAGHLIFVRAGTLFAQPFDTGSLRLTGAAIPLAEGIPSNRSFGRTGFSATPSGMLAFWPAIDVASRLIWYSRSGQALGTLGDSSSYRQIGLSPDGKQVIAERRGSGGGEIWILDAIRAAPRRITYQASVGDPVWSPDGRQIAFFRGGSARGFEIVVKNLEDGKERTVVTSESGVYPEDWSRDGKSLLYLSSRFDVIGGSIDIAAMTEDRPPHAVIESPFTKDEPHFSPDGHWLVYQSDEAGTTDVYVQPYPGPGESVRISTNGGGQPRWRADGKELFYVTSDGKMMSVSIKVSAGRLEPGPPEQLFQLGFVPNLIIDQYAVTGDGKRFLVIEPLARLAPITVIVNWPGLLKK